MCGASESSELECDDDELTENKDYIPNPFSEEEFEPAGWMDILATLDICVNNSTQTKFCDDERYDISPLCMIRVELEQPTQVEESEMNENKCEEWAILHVKAKDEISIRDLSENEDEEIRNEVYYDAFDELDMSEDD